MVSGVQHPAQIEVGAGSALASVEPGVGATVISHRATVIVAVAVELLEVGPA